MEIVDLITPERIACGLRATSKKQALKELSKRIADVSGLDDRHVLDVIVAREKLGTTGVGNGIAIPHGKLLGLDHLFGFFARLEPPVDFQALDDRPVDLVFLLLAPEHTGADHLKALACISRLLRDATIQDKLRGAGQADALFAILTAGQENRAA